MLKIGAHTCLRTIVKNLVKPSTETVLAKENLLSFNVQSYRNTSFFNRLTQTELWKGVTSVSNAGKRRGRGRLGDRRGKRNLNEGQRIGDGKIRVLWPGLNSSILGSQGVSEVVKLPASDKPVTPAHTANITTIKYTRSRKVHPLDRGWTARHSKGRFIGPPNPVQDETFEDFNSVILDLKLATVMTSILGRKRKFFSIVATGNGNGLIGFGASKTVDAKTSISLSKHRASRRLLTVDLIDKHTVNHDFFSVFGRTRIFVFKRPEGYGLHCHRIIAAICKLVGIENLYAKIEGSKNPKHIIRAFVVGLLKQKTYQDIADEKKLHLVEFKEETHNFPQVLASPEKCLTPAEARRNPTTFEEYIMGGKLVFKKGPKLPFYTKLPSWQTHLNRTLFFRNHDKVKVELLTKYGSCSSHLTRVYPECKNKV